MFFLINLGNPFTLLSNINLYDWFLLNYVYKEHDNSNKFRIFEDIKFSLIRIQIKIFELFKYLKNLYLVYTFLNSKTFSSFYAIRNIDFKNNSLKFLKIYKQMMGEGIIYIRGLFIIFFIDACVTDDEPL